jgi:hypothetical protein
MCISAEINTFSIVFLLHVVALRLIHRLAQSVAYLQHIFVGVPYAAKNFERDCCD